MGIPQTCSQTARSQNTNIHGRLSKFYFQKIGLDDSNLVGNIESIKILCQAHICLLDPVRSYKSVNLGAGNIVHLFNCLRDLALIGTNVGDEDKGVVVFDLLHRRLSS